MNLIKTTKDTPIETLKPIRLFVGLSNPGPEYQGTRHNLGQVWLEQLISKHSISLSYEKKLMGKLAQLPDQGEQNKCYLLVPTTFMNLSGQAVVKTMHFYKLVPQEVLIIHDDLDLPAGKIKLKFSGGHGGHNGLRNIMECLNSRNFWRLRIGIGRPSDERSVSDFVLSRPRAFEQTKIDEALAAALSVAPLILAGHMNQATKILHAPV